jgi:hypothetical protein
VRAERRADNSRTKPADSEADLWSLGLAKQVPIQALTPSERTFNTDHVETYEFPVPQPCPESRAPAQLLAASGVGERAASR